MALKDRITEDMKTAMRAGEKERLATIRLALAAIKQREVDERITLDDTQVLAVLEKMIKQRREAVTQFESGGRADLVAKENAEIALRMAKAEAGDSFQRAIDLATADRELAGDRRTMFLDNARAKLESLRR